MIVKTNGSHAALVCGAMLRQCVPGLLIATINTDCVPWLLQLGRGEDEPVLGPSFVLVQVHRGCRHKLEDYINLGQ